MKPTDLKPANPPPVEDLGERWIGKTPLQTMTPTDWGKYQHEQFGGGRGKRGPSKKALIEADTSKNITINVTLEQYYLLERLAESKGTWLSKAIKDLALEAASAAFPGEKG